MPIRTTWIIPGQFIQLRFEGDIRPEEVQALHGVLRDALKEVSGKLHYLLDLTLLSPTLDELLMQPLLDRYSALRSTHTGHLLIVGTTERMRLVMDSLGLALHLNTHFFLTIDEALAFIAEVE